ncbi:MAG: hypothetical protein HKP09_07105, partial [Enterobacterales bacterium]|nr:hypothetical protein [Enterobacterales bacterium]
MNNKAPAGIDAEYLQKRIEAHLSYTLGDFRRESDTVNKRAWWEAVCMTAN